jgi:hypothetical protein
MIRSARLSSPRGHGSGALHELEQQSEDEHADGKEVGAHTGADQAEDDADDAGQDAEGDKERGGLSHAPRSKRVTRGRSGS